MLSKISSTLARDNGCLVSVPLKMIESIDSPRSSFAEDEPITHLTDSTTLDLPQPLGPTIEANCPSIRIVVGSTKLLKPAILICRNFNLGFFGKI